mmetsp:Transcript_31430/g.83700  ORF Transcript_31430/g.83700 Transcript_31430/m.83700 type:complete len:243 (-) Transcript_31430:103-831(-)
MVSALENGNERTSGVETNLLYRGHDCLGAAHVKSHFILPEHAPQHVNILESQRMHGTETHGALLRNLIASVHELLEARVTIAINSIGTARVQVNLSIHVGDIGAIHLAQDSDHVELVGEHLLEDGKGAFEARGLEPQIRPNPKQTLADLLGLRPPLVPVVRKSLKRCLAPCSDIFRRAVHTEELFVRQIPEHDERTQQTPHRWFQVRCLHSFEHQVREDKPVDNRDCPSHDGEIWSSVGQPT